MTAPNEWQDQTAIGRLADHYDKLAVVRGRKIGFVFQSFELMPRLTRVGGTMVYESDDFYRACDELGLLVWQDFMFARMDYPQDQAFVSSVTTEATQQVHRLSRHPSVALYCGNSEVEQQAAMVGVPRDAWRSRLFSEVLPEICARWHPAAPYVPSTPSGGAMPFHADSGITHYYGVGAYLRPVADARRAGGK